LLIVFAIELLLNDKLFLCQLYVRYIYFYQNMIDVVNIILIYNQIIYLLSNKFLDTLIN